MATLAKFQVTNPKTWKGLTSKNHLGSFFRAQPQLASEVMVQVMASKNGPTLDTFINQFPTKTFKDDTEFYWHLVGTSTKNIPLVEARTMANAAIPATGNIGAGGEPFKLVFAEDYFARGEVIVGSMNELYPFRILEDPQFEGTNTVYVVSLMGSAPAGVPVSLLTAGERFSWDFAPVESELSRKVGDIRVAAPVTVSNEWTTIRIQHKAAGAMLNKQVGVGIPIVTANNTVQVTPFWMHYEDFVVEETFRTYKNNALAFSRSNKNSNGEFTDYGISGNVIRMGDGIFAQSEVSNTIYYNDTSTIMDTILDALYELSEGKLGYGERKFVIMTGERGAALFNRAAKDTMSGWMPLGVKYSEGNPPSISKTTAPFSSAAVRVTDYQVTEWVAPNGVEVKVIVNEAYSNKVRNKIQHPEGGVAFSYRFDIWYLGTSEQPNIQKAAIEGQPELRGYQWGLRNPFTGEINNTSMSYDEDSAVIHKMATLGAIVYDPTKTMSIIPSILRG